MNTHFFDKDDITIIFALNGFIWIQANKELTKEIMLKIAQLRNLILILNENYISLHPKALF